VKPYIIHFLSSVALSSSLLFIPTLAAELGGSESEIGIIIAAYALAMFISSYIFGRLSDTYSRRLFISLGLAVSAIVFLLQILADPHFAVSSLATPTFLAVVRAAAGFSLGIFPAALMVYVYDSAGPLGRFAAIGALGWAVGTFIAGVIAEANSYYAIFLIASLFLWAAFILSMTMKNVEFPRLKVPFFPKDLLKKNWRVYAPYLLRHTGANTIWVIYPLFIASLGGDKFWIGIIYTVNTGAQFVVMPFLDRFEGKRLIRIGLLMAIVTFFSFTLAQNFLYLLPIQVLLACSWAFMYVGSLQCLMKDNVEKATSSGILTSVIYMAQVFGSLAGGVVAQVFGDFKTTMYVAVILTIVGFILFSSSNKKRTAH
jgi:MFS family permease